jgi:NDP-sugar pyrophosphorylase family protein
VKIITLAAGRGTRVQSGPYTPKALVGVGGKTLLEWSIDSFHAIRSQGLVKPEDLVFVFVKEDFEGFGIQDRLLEFFGKDIKVVVLDQITAGPAETVKFAIEKLIQDGHMSEEETVIINDCDHFFKSGPMLRTLEKISTKRRQIVLHEVEKDPSDLSWSFVQRESNEIVGVVEKPTELSSAGLDTSVGIVGVYIFSQAQIFRDLFRLNTSNPAVGEAYISQLVNLAINLSEEYEVIVSRVQYFVPLGSHAQISKALSDDSLSLGFREPISIFVDLDGTVILHDVSKPLGSGEYGKLKELTPSPIMQLNKMYLDGNTIVITTARNESSRKSLEYELSAMGIMYDQLIMGLSGGPRVLINDSKPSLPGFLTAWSINTARNVSAINQLENLVETINNMKLVECFPSESGETTILLESNERKIIRKISQATDASKELITYQTSWLRAVREFIPEMIPEVLGSQSNIQNSFAWYDMEYIENLSPLGEHIFRTDMRESKLAIEKLLSGLQVIYDKFESKSKTDMSDVLDVIEHKAISGIERGISELGLNVESQNFPLTVNGEIVQNVLTDVKMYLNRNNKKLVDLLKSERFSPTLIHGDPTLSNIVMGGGSQIFLLDPIGSRVHPKFSHLTEGLGRSNPIYDHSRIRLSLLDEYERWNAELILTGDNQSDLLGFDKHKLADDLYGHFDSIWNRNNPITSVSVKNLIHFTTLARVLPYKARSKRKEAIYILYLLSKEWTIIKELFT